MLRGGAGGTGTVFRFIVRTTPTDVQEYRDSPINRLLKGLRPIPITIHPRPATDHSNITMPSQRGQPVQIFWSPTESGSYDDGASKLPCATLLHELTHAWQNYNGEYSNEDL